MDTDDYLPTISDDDREAAELAYATYNPNTTRDSDTGRSWVSGYLIGKMDSNVGLTAQRWAARRSLQASRRATIAAVVALVAAIGVVVWNLVA